MIWKNLETEQQLESLIQAPESGPFVIFKHSTRCNISQMIKDRLERKTGELPEGIPIYYLDLISFRSLSNQIADCFQVEHQSPQLLLIKGDTCLYHASHSAISVDSLNEHIRLSEN
ncbi:MAG: bacillithiol system redox-active protein YtxJ [Bacteroidota bacterium]